ncbi:folate-binding protein YgfZ [Thioflavicoccus mobilis 8321]|uniref:Folate-binding protein YgfZ n=1 Tax=Thioflavicoccus mobilis 8321 TaxID=765912 RepID=L0GZH9_9GAMM|nr:folate-binding protein YgfZ [Thioflavicoccus mobilis]AGA90719.1 folate-binding protein YgfZ [Thioflavicoccus mobilis 8321]
MNSEWKAFLESLSARIDDDGRVAFPGPPAHANCMLVDLSHLGLIAVDGPDAREFLQGQLTNDVRELSDRHTQLSGYCSPKGRMLANFRLLRLGETIFMQLPRDQIEATLKRLQMFVLRSRTRLRDASDELVAIGIAGDEALTRIGSACGALPELDNGLTRIGELAILRIPGTPARFEALGPVAAVKDLWQRLAEGAGAAGAEHWRLLDIRAGLPTVFPETREAFVPQMTNMHLIDGVSFTKGCYTGQEVVARMQHLGKLKRRMYLAEVETGTPPRPGDVLFSPDSHSGQGTGIVVDAQESAPGRYELLAVVEVESAEQDHVRLGIDGPHLTLRAPPYGFRAAS